MPSYEMLLDNHRDILWLDSGIPDSLRIDDHRRTPGMLSGAAGPTDQDFFGQPQPIDLFTKRLEELKSSKTPAVARPVESADEDMVAKGTRPDESLAVAGLLFRSQRGSLGVAD